MTGAREDDKIFGRVPRKGDGRVGVGVCALCDASPCVCQNHQMSIALAAELRWCGSFNQAREVAES